MRFLPKAEKVLDLAVASGGGDVLDVDGRVGRHDECVVLCCLGMGIKLVRKKV